MSVIPEDGTSEDFRSAAQRLRVTMAAVRISLSWFGTRKTLMPEQRSQAADTLGDSP